MNLILLYEETDWRVTKIFRDAKAAADAAEAGYVAVVYKDQDGDLEDGEPLFWKAYLMLSSGEVKTEKTDTYKWGSADAPCRDGHVSGPGQFAVIQALDYIVAWGITEAQAIERVKSQEVEGRKRAARDAALKAALDAEMRPGEWDPYGRWIGDHPGLWDRAQKAADEAYAAA